MSLSEILAWVLAVISASSTIVVAVLQHRDKNNERKFQLKLKQLDFYDLKRAEAIENYVRSVDRSIMSQCLDDEYKSCATTIYIYCNPILWTHISDIGVSLGNGHYDAAQFALESFCKAHYFLSEQKTESEKEKLKNDETNKPRTGSAPQSARSPKSSLFRNPFKRNHKSRYRRG